MNKELWEDQKAFNKQFFKDLGLDLDSLSISEKTEWTKEFVFNINNELTEIVKCFPLWKMHYRNNEREEYVVSSNVKEEFIDAFKYLLGLAQVLGLSYDDILNVYKEKTEVVKQKYLQNKNMENIRHKKAIVFDIDGVINNYPDCFVYWVNCQNSTGFETLEEIKRYYEQKEYEDLKIAYRLSGEKKTQPVNEDTVKTMVELHKSGETIILFTNRPISKYKRILSDTLFWLQSNQIPFDAIYWTDFHEKEDIYSLNLDIKYIVEDNLNNAKQFNHQGHLVYLLDKYYNQSDYSDECFVRIEKVSEIWSL